MKRLTRNRKKYKHAISIDEAIKKLESIRKTSKFGGETRLVLCLIDSEISYANVANIELETDPDGAIARVDVFHEELCDPDYLQEKIK